MQHLAKGLNFSHTDDAIAQLVHDICQLHDLGKYTEFFQAYLMGDRVDPQKKSHARLGAYSFYQKWKAQDEVLAYWGYFLIKNHHTALHWPKDEEKDKLLDKISGYPEKSDIFNIQKQSLSPHWPAIESELSMAGLRNYVQIPECKLFRKFLKDRIIKRGAIEDYFFLNYCFSLLIEADKLDASQTEPYPRLLLPVNAVDAFLAARKSEDNPHNRLRQQVRSEVMAVLDEADTLQCKLFTLTAPTGIGKTLTALDFALKLRAQLPGIPQIITALPFINIIEQTLQEYKKVLGDSDASILGHYQYADIFGEEEKEDTGQDGQDAERRYEQRRMELNTWQADIVVTSFVQFLQTLISNRNKMLLKFHHLANAIVIMDEVQNIPIQQAPFIGSMIYYCSHFLNTRFILMTATKPLIFELAQREIIYRQSPEKNILPEVKELLREPERIYRVFNRTKIVPLLDEPLLSEADFIELFKTHWKPGQSCLIVCNKVNRSLAIFEAIKAFLEGQEYSRCLYYLSTNVLPVDRAMVIGKISRVLKRSSAKPILVATQVVEAGVDLDFDCGFRDLGPIDAIVQVAGRINRENSPKRAGSPLYVFDTKDCDDVYGVLTAQQARKALGNEPIEEPDYFNLVDTYFGTVAGEDMVNYAEARSRFKGVEAIYYTDGKNLISDRKGEIPEMWPICDFQVIKNAAYYSTVFIEKSDAAEQAKIAFLEMLAARDKEEKRRLKSLFDREYRTIFQQHTLPVPNTYTEGLPLIVPDFPDLKILYVAKQEVEKWYSFPGTGFKRDQAKQEHLERNKALSL